MKKKKKKKNLKRKNFKNTFFKKKLRIILNMTYEFLFKSVVKINFWLKDFFFEHEIVILFFYKHIEIIGCTIYKNDSKDLKFSQEPIGHLADSTFILPELIINPNNLAKANYATYKKK